MNPQQFNFLGNNTLQNFQNNTGGMINQTSNESEKFPGLTKQQETEIMNKANQANVTESQKNYMLNDMYQQQLRRNQIDKFAEERENTKRQLIRRAVESKDIKTSKQSKQIEKKGDVADMIRKYVSATQEIDLNKLNKVSDDQIIADFTADNPDVAYAIDDFTKSQMSSQYFSEMMGFSQFEEQQDEGFFKNLLNSITYGVETGAKGLKGLIDKGLDTAEGNSNESSYSMENLTAFDNYIQHKYGVSGSQLRESDKEVWQQERNLVQDNPEVLKQYMTTASEDALNFAEGYTDALFTATNPYMALGMKTVGAAEQEMGGGVLTWLAEKMGGVGEIINSIPGLSNYRDTLSPEDQQRFDAFVGNVAVGLILGTKNKKNIIKDPKTFLMENLQPNQITKNFVQSVTGMPDRLLGGTDSLAGGAKGLMSKAAKGVDNAGNVLDRAAEWGAKKITGTATAQDKLYKAQEPRMNILSEKKNLERRRANSDRANELILDNGYKPTNTSERLDAHQKTLNKLWGQVMEKVNAQEGVNVDQSSMITALSDYIKSKKKLGVAGISSDIKALEAELKSLKKMQAEGNTDIPTLEAKKQVLNDLIDRKGQEASEVYKGGIKLLTQEIGKIEDSIISQIPGEFSELKRDVGALLDSYEDVFKADMKNQRKKGLGLTETYSRIEGIGDTLGGIVKLFGGDASGLVKGLGKLALGKSLAKASDVDFLIKQGFEDLANEKGLAESQASSKTAKYQVADQTTTPEFKKWFDGSKVVDKEGKPLEVYHGSRHAGFTEFKPVNTMTDGLWFFSDKRGISSYFGGGKELRSDKGLTAEFEKAKKRGVEAVKDFAVRYLGDSERMNVTENHIAPSEARQFGVKPGYSYVLDNGNVSGPIRKNGERIFDKPLTKEEIDNAIIDRIGESVEFAERGDNKNSRVYASYLSLKNPIEIDAKGVKFNEVTNPFNGRKMHIANIAYDAIDRGYDGAIIKNVSESPEYDLRGTVYIAGNPSQIKSATDNIGTFDKNNPDIRYQKYGVAGQGEKGISATEGLNIRNFKNGKTVQELANQYGIDTKIVDSISTPEGQRAYGMYGDRLITLSKDLKESTVPHELLHGVFDMVDSKRRTSILEGIQKNLNIDNVQAEEWLADSFSEYYRTGKFGTKGLAKTFVEKVKQFFYEVKSYIDGTYKNEKQIRQLFDDIIDGKIEGEYGVYSDPKFQSVWHGSPYSFEKFDSAHMGEGEGAQAHGWGHYVAKDKETGYSYSKLQDKKTQYRGEGYRNPSDRNGYGVSDKDMLIDEFLRELDRGEKYEDIKRYYIEQEKDIINGCNRWLKEAKKEGVSELEGFTMEEIQIKKKLAQEKIDLINSIKKEDFIEVGQNLYEVEIPDPIKKDTPTGKNYLDEDEYLTKEQVRDIMNKAEEQKYGGLKPFEDADFDDVEKIANEVFSDLSEQQRKVSVQQFVDDVSDMVEFGDKTIPEAIDSELEYHTMLSSTMRDRKAKAGLYEKGKDYPATDGKGLYNELQYLLGGDKEASKFLESLGYDGIHYFGGRDGEAYVIFNDDALEITKHHKY